MTRVAGAEDPLATLIDNTMADGGSRIRRDEVAGDGGSDPAILFLPYTAGCTAGKETGCQDCELPDNLRQFTGSEGLLQQFEYLLLLHERFSSLRIVTSSSFLDPRDLDPGVQDIILGMLRDRVDLLIIEVADYKLTRADLERLVKSGLRIEIRVGMGMVDHPTIPGRKSMRGFTHGQFAVFQDQLLEIGDRISAELVMRPTGCRAIHFLGMRAQSVQLTGVE